MNKLSLRTASILCLGIWVAVWLLFMALRFSHIDVRVIPGIGFVLLASLAASVLAPLVGAGLAVISFVRRRGALPEALIFAAAIGELAGQSLLFRANSWL